MNENLQHDDVAARASSALEGFGSEAFNPLNSKRGRKPSAIVGVAVQEL